MNTVPSKSQIKWQCRRGMLELDFILEKFVDNYFDALSDVDKKTFAQLLTEDDPTLYDWLVVGHEPVDSVIGALVVQIRK